MTKTTSVGRLESQVPLARALVCGVCIGWRWRMGIGARRRRVHVGMLASAHGCWCAHRQGVGCTSCEHVGKRMLT